MNYMIYDGDLPDDYEAGAAIAIDTETMGLNPHRDRLCLVQMSRGDGSADLVQIRRGQTSAPNLEAVLTNPAIVKLFHFGRFDIFWPGLYRNDDIHRGIFLALIPLMSPSKYSPFSNKEVVPPSMSIPFSKATGGIL